MLPVKDDLKERGPRLEAFLRYTDFEFDPQIWKKYSL